MKQPWETTFESREDLSEYGDNALGLFALGLKFGIDDLVSVAADSITDGSDDKKCDIVYIDQDENLAVVSQCYFSSKQKNEAPANKASDLNTAVAWLLERPINQLPERIVSAAKELRAGINSGAIKTIHFWYVHNLPESKNVKAELMAVEGTASAALQHNFQSPDVKVHSLEVGKNQLHEWYTETLSPILVNDNFELVIENGYEVEGPDWNAYVTSIPAKFLWRIYKKYKEQLFSANVRDYLGSRSSDSNINNGIKKTAEKQPDYFWVFNNGLTVLVHSFEEIGGSKKKLNIKGISIVNGAQTTGAIGSLAKSPSEDAYVPVRFVSTQSTDVISNIIQFNNSQNKVTASDFRSTDKTQKRLKEQIQKIPKAIYEGGRRGGSGDVIKRRPDLLPSYTVGQSLAALHGDPIIAYNQKANIWTDDKLYSKYFNEDTTAAHIVFAYSLLRAIEERKLCLLTKLKKNEQGLTSIENQQINFFRKRGSHYLLMSAIAGCIETLVDKKIPNLFRLSFGDNTSPKDAQKIWAEILDITLPLSIQLESALSEGLNSVEKVNLSIQGFKALVQVTAGSNEKQFKAFRSRIVFK